MGSNAIFVYSAYFITILAVIILQIAIFKQNKKLKNRLKNLERK